MRRQRLACLVALAGLSFLSGCQQIGQAAYFLGPRRVQKPEFELTEGRLAVLIEAARSDFENPVFTRAMHERLIEIFRENETRTEIVSYEETLRLRQEKSEYRSWSLQRIGRELGADQVLYLRIEQLRLLEQPDLPVLSPSVTLRAKVVGIEADPAKPRLWPTDEEYRTTEVKRPTQEAGAQQQIDAEAAKLGRDAAYTVSMPFFEIDLEAPTPRER